MKNKYPFRNLYDSEILPLKIFRPFIFSKHRQPERPAHRTTGCFRGADGGMILVFDWKIIVP